MVRTAVLGIPQLDSGSYFSAVNYFLGWIIRGFEILLG